MNHKPVIRMTNALQDEGCYEYIDETFNETERSSVLANSETILSEDQTDRVHSAAMKAMGKMADDTNAIRMSSSAFVSSASASQGGEQQQDQDIQEVDGDSDEDHLLDPNPFAKVFGRLRGGATPAPAKRALPKQASGRPEQKQENKKARTTTPAVGETRVQPGQAARNRKEKRRADGDDGELQSDFGAKAPVPSGTDDSELIDSYQSQLDKLQALDAEGSADQVFVPWCKHRTTKLQELKQGSAWRDCACVSGFRSQVHDFQTDADANMGRDNDSTRLRDDTAGYWILRYSRFNISSLAVA